MCVCVCVNMRVCVCKHSCKILYYALHHGRLNTRPGPRTVTSNMLRVIKLGDSRLTLQLLCTHTLCHFKLE